MARQRHHKPRRVSVLLHPLGRRVPPLLWQDWSRRQHRRACMQLLRHQRVEVRIEPGLSASPRSHQRLCPARSGRIIGSRLQSGWLAMRGFPLLGQVTIRLFGVPEDFAVSLGLATA